MPSKHTGDANSVDHHAPALGRHDVLPVAGFVAIVIAMFWRVLFTSGMFFYRDVFNYSFPRAEFIRHALLHDYLPYWNPHFSFGEPVLANPNFLFFYPSTLLLVVLPAGYAYCLHYVIHFALAGIGTYWLARRWDASRLGAFFAACVFGLGGPLLSLGDFYNQAACAAWIPWALLATDYAIRAPRGRSRRPWILLAGVFTLQFLAAEPLTLLATFGLSFAYALAIGGNLRRPWSAANGRIVAAFVLVGALMLGLGAVELFPSLDLLHHSRRGVSGLPFNEVAYWSLHPLTLLDMVVPEFFGSVFDAPTLWTSVLGNHNQPYYPSLFVGFIPLFFALLGWALGKNPRRRFVALASLVLLILAFGRFTPVFHLAYTLVPPLHLVRFPAKLLVPALLLVAILAAWGVDAVRESIFTHRRAQTILPFALVLGAAGAVWMIALVAPGSIARASSWVLTRTNDMFIRTPAERLNANEIRGAAQYLLGRISLEFPGLAGFALGGILWLIALERRRGRIRWVLPAVIALGIAQLAHVNYGANPVVPRSFYTYELPVVDQPHDAAHPYRFATLVRDERAPEAQSLLSFDGIPAAAGFSTTAQIAFRDRLLLQRGAMLAGVDVSENLDMEGSLPPAYYQFWIYELEDAPDLARADCLLGRANVKYIVRRAPQASATTRAASPIFNGSPQPSYLYEDLCFSPRAFVAGAAVQSSNAAETLSRLSDPAFDAAGTVILNDDKQGSGSAPRSTPDVPGAAGTVSFVAREANRVTLRAELARPGYVVLLDRYDPNWHATLDGRPVQILRADHMFRAVHAGPGEHVIRFEYRQKGLAACAAVSVATLALLILLGVKG